MDLSPSEHGPRWLARLQQFLERHVLPHNAAWHRHAQEGEPAAFVEDLRRLPREEGLSNLCLPGLQPHEPGTRLSNIDCAPLAKAMGRLRWSPPPRIRRTCRPRSAAKAADW